ncbi:MAG: response regulator, partial [Elusimicrobia bacterium]|nr:response regulator [Elusimicrobiota bacterium]
RFFQRALEDNPSLEIKGTHSGYEAGFLTKSFKPDLILLDIFLKDIDGRQVTELIRSDPALKHTKIVAISSTQDPEIIRGIKALEITDFIQKPVSAKELRQKIENLLRN